MLRYPATGWSNISIIKAFCAIAGIAALGIGATHVFSSSSGRVTSQAQEDMTLLWRDSCGPKRECNPASLPLYRAIIDRDRDGVAKLLDSGVPVNGLLFPQKYSPLMVALSVDDDEIVRTLISRGADLNYISDDIIYTTPLALSLSMAMHKAVEAAEVSGKPVSVDFDMFRYLMHSGANINLEFRGQDIAIYAADMGQMELVSELLAAGYNRDLIGLRDSIRSRAVDEKSEEEKEAILTKLNHIIK